MCVCVQFEVCPGEMEGGSHQEREGERARGRSAPLHTTQEKSMALLERGVCIFIMVWCAHITVWDGKPRSMNSCMTVCLYSGTFLCSRHQWAEISSFQRLKCVQEYYTWGWKMCPV